MRLGVPDHIHAGAVDRGFINISESLELIAHPTQEILSRAVFLGRSWWDSPAYGCHLSHTEISICGPSPVQGVLSVRYDLEPPFFNPDSKSH